MSLDSKTLNLLSSIPSDCAELMASYHFQSFLEEVPQEVLDKFVGYINKADISKETFQRFCNNFHSLCTFLNIFENFTTEELESVTFQSIANLNRDLYPSTIQDIKNGIAATPKAIRDFIKKDVGFAFYADWKK